MHLVRCAGTNDAAVVGRLLYDFNREFDEPTPAPAALAERLRQLIEGGETVVLLGGDGPDGLAVLRFRAAIWSGGLECYLAELYVRPAVEGEAWGGRSWRRPCAKPGCAAPTRWTSAWTSLTSPPAACTRASASPTGSAELTVR